MGDGELAAFAVAGQRLGVAQVRGAGGGIARVADGHVADEIVQDFAVENLRDQPHALVFAELAAVARDDAGAFLAAMLQGVEAVIRQLGGVGMAVNAKDAAIMFWIRLHEINSRRAGLMRAFRPSGDTAGPEWAATQGQGAFFKSPMKQTPRQGGKLIRVFWGGGGPAATLACGS